MPLSDRSNSIWHNDIIITWHSWLVLFYISSQWAWLMLSVAVAVRFRNPPPSPAPPVYIGYGVIHVSYIWGLFHTVYVICAAAVFLTCSQQHACGCIGSSSKSLYLLCHSKQRSRSIPPRPNTQHWHVHYHAKPSKSLNPPRVVMTEIYFSSENKVK